MKTLLVDVLMMGTGFGVNSSFFATAGEELSPTYGSFSFDTLEYFMVVGFLGGIVPANETII